MRTTFLLLLSISACEIPKAPENPTTDEENCEGYYCGTGRCCAELFFDVAQIRECYGDDSSALIGTMFESCAHDIDEGGSVCSLRKCDLEAVPRYESVWATSTEEAEETCAPWEPGALVATELDNIERDASLLCPAAVIGEFELGACEPDGAPVWYSRDCPDQYHYPDEDESTGASFELEIDRALSAIDAKLGDTTIRSTVGGQAFVAGSGADRRMTKGHANGQPLTFGGERLTDIEMSLKGALPLVGSSYTADPKGFEIIVMGVRPNGQTFAVHIQPQVKSSGTFNLTTRRWTYLYEEPGLVRVKLEGRIKPL